MSDPRGEKLRDLIYRSKDEIKNITAAVSEYYFTYAGKTFSLLCRNDGMYVLFGYPKWSGGIDNLIEYLERGYEHPSTMFVNIFESQHDETLLNLFAWLKSKDSGVDDFYRELGVD
jgi:hypothetical protein